jgi:two-component system chemotaxis response regulator CheY
VLLVEPSRVQAGIVRGYLKEIEAGDVQIANSGRAALEAVRTAPPRLIVSAMHLPDLTGVELAGQVRALPGGSDIGFVLVASEADGHAADTIHAIPGATLLHKPFDGPQLEQAIRRVQARRTTVKERASLRILLVDDSTTARMLLRQMLAKLGVNHVTDVSSGARALAMLEQESFDLVLTDLVMAGMDGKELAVRIRAQRAVPIVVMTATTDPALEQELRQAGVTAVCDKAGLADAVGGVLDRMSGAAVSAS